jgi:hypothetical protein
MPTSDVLTVLLLEEGESLSSFASRVKKSTGEVLVVVADRDAELDERPQARKQIIDAVHAHARRIQLATKHPQLAAEARGKGLRVVDRTRELKRVLKGHPSFGAALQVFAPHQWRQQLTSQLQRMGLLSMPKLRVYGLVALSSALFLFVVFKLLPSAEIRISPRQEPISQTVNVYLVQSGASVNIPPRARVMPLLPLVVTTERTVVSDHVSKEFIGESASMQMTVVNTSDEPFSLRKGTRFTNQAGMVFRLQEAVIVPPKKEQAVPAVADPLDQYGQIIGARGNVPAGLTWQIPGLPEDVRRVVFGRNAKPATGGKTAYKTVVRKEDLDLARKRLEQELLAEARRLIDAESQRRGAADPDAAIVVLQPQKYPELTRATYSGFVLPQELIGRQDVPSISVRGELKYTVFAYDAQSILSFLRDELTQHVGAGKELVEESLGLKRLVAHVIDFASDLSWIKLTVDLTGTERYVLDPLSPRGAVFAKTVRESVAGLDVEEALRIVKNMPEVEDASISMWPPWTGRLPGIPSHISISPQ